MVNKAILIGRVGREPDYREFESGAQRVMFSIVTTRRGFTDKSGRKVEEKSEWHSISCWGGLAKVVADLVNKGDLVYIEGEIVNRMHEADGEKKYYREIAMSSIELLSKASDKRNQAQEEEASTYEEEEESDGLPF